MYKTSRTDNTLCISIVMFRISGVEISVKVMLDMKSVMLYTLMRQVTLFPHFYIMLHKHVSSFTADG